MITEKHILEEARNIVRNQPVAPGDTLAMIAEDRAHAERNDD